MTKVEAIDVLGGSVGAAAAAIGVTYQAVDKWPDVLPPRIEDRVLAVLARKHLPPGLWRRERDVGGDAHSGTVTTPGENRAASQTDGEKV